MLEIFLKVLLYFYKYERKFCILGFFLKYLKYKVFVGVCKNILGIKKIIELKV